MSFKYFVPKTRENIWQEYWSKTDIKKDLRSCNKDELWKIIKRYVGSTDRIIEAGCGLGRWVIFLSRKSYNITGIDSFKGAVEKIKRVDSSLKLKVADVRCLPFKNEEFDVYLSFGVIEHFEEGPREVLKEAKRVLRKRGIIILETPHDNFSRKTTRLLLFIKNKAKNIIKIFLNKSPKPELEFQFYEYRYTTGELKKFLKDLNFKILNTFAKDLYVTDESIGFWSDYPFLRSKDGKPFKLNRLGMLIKGALKPFKFLFSGCTVVVAQKI